MKFLIVFTLIILTCCTILMAENDSDDSESEESTTMDPTGEPTNGTEKNKSSSNKRSKYGSKPVNDSLILGMYRLSSDIKNEDFNEYLIAMEFSKEDRERIRNSYMIHVTIEKGWKKKHEYVFKTYFGFKVTSDTFKLGEEYESELSDGRKYNATVYMYDNIVVREQRHDGWDAFHKAAFNPNGFEIEMTAKNKTAKQVYGRNNDNHQGFLGALKSGFEKFFNG